MEERNHEMIGQTLERFLAKVDEAERNGLDPAFCARVRDLATRLAMEGVPSWMEDCARVARESGMADVARTPSPINLRGGICTAEQSQRARKSPL